MEGGARTDGGRGFASVLFAEFPRDDWFVGGRTDNRYIAAPGSFLINVTVPEGYMNGADKSGVHAAVNGASLKVTAPVGEPHAGSSILAVIDEVPEGNWGARGETISLANIASTVGLAKNGKRFAWVRSYFDAKARLRAAFAYPADTGGLLPVEERPG